MVGTILQFLSWVFGCLLAAAATIAQLYPAESKQYIARLLPGVPMILDSVYFRILLWIVIVGSSSYASIGIYKIWRPSRRASLAKAIDDISAAQKSIRDWAEPIFDGLSLDLEFNRPVSDYGDDPTRVIGMKSTIDNHDAQWRLKINEFVVFIGSGYRAYKEAREKLNMADKANSEAVRAIRTEMREASDRIIYGCNNISTRLKR